MRFHKFSIFADFLPFFIKKTWFYLDPHNLKTLSRTSMKFGMDLHHGNALGRF